MFMHLTYRHKQISCVKVRFKHICIDLFKKWIPDQIRWVHNTEFFLSEINDLNP